MSETTIGSWEHVATTVAKTSVLVSGKNEGITLTSRSSDEHSGGEAEMAFCDSGEIRGRAASPISVFRRLGRPAPTVAMLVGVLVVVGCSPGTDNEPSTTDVSSPAEAVSEPTTTDVSSPAEAVSESTTTEAEPQLSEPRFVIENSGAGYVSDGPWVTTLVDFETGEVLLETTAQQALARDVGNTGVQVSRRAANETGEVIAFDPWTGSVAWSWPVSAGRVGDITTTTTGVVVTIEDSSGDVSNLVALTEAGTEAWTMSVSDDDWLYYGSGAVVVDTSEGTTEVVDTATGETLATYPAEIRRTTTAGMSLSATGRELRFGTLFWGSSYPTMRTNRGELLHMLRSNSEGRTTPHSVSARGLTLQAASQTSGIEWQTSSGHRCSHPSPHRATPNSSYSPGQRRSSRWMEPPANWPGGQEQRPPVSTHTATKRPTYSSLLSTPPIPCSSTTATAWSCSAPAQVRSRRPLHLVATASDSEVPVMLGPGADSVLAAFENGSGTTLALYDASGVAWTTDI